MVDPFSRWLVALERRHLADLTFAEFRRGVQALSHAYVQGRDRLARGAPLEGRAKRAAFAAFYAPLHFLTVRGILDAVDGQVEAPATVLDLGCGTGAAGAAWALRSGGGARLRGIERNAWAVGEARRTTAELGLSARFERRDLCTRRSPVSEPAIIAAFTMNELEESCRQRWADQLIDAARRGSRVLIVEPIARRTTPWWDRWRSRFLLEGGRAETWRLATPLPEFLQRIDRAAGLDHHELTARSLDLGFASRSPGNGNG